MVSDQQVRKLMKLVKTENSLDVAAAKAGMSPKTARRYNDAEDPALAIAACKPVRINQRLIAQQGLFLVPLNLKHSFMENLGKCLDLREAGFGEGKCATTDDPKAAEPSLSVLKIIIPKDNHRALLFHLKRMNITEATLFPGLDGFARSLNYYAVGMELAP